MVLSSPALKFELSKIILLTLVLLFLVSFLYHLKEFGRGQQRPRNYKELFNHRHAVLRNHIERAIGVLKKRFPILKVGTHHPIENQVKIPVAAVVFHNLIRMLNGDEYWLNRHGSNISPNQFVDVPEGDIQYNNDVMYLNNQIDDGNAVRDMIALNMWNDYSHSCPNKSTMLVRGSPRFNLMQVAAAQRKPSPKISKVQKKKASPKAVQDRSRASWNAGLEKGLVELLHDHNNDCFRAQNAWSTEAWNKIYKLFLQKFPHAQFSRTQIQDKERELKREYRVLKEARKQSGASWDDKLCRIVADQAVWDNILVSYPKAKKFENKSFPLFEALGELYDGQIAEGTLNFTSIAPSQVAVTQPSQVPITRPSQVCVTQPSHQVHITQLSQNPFTQPSQVHITQLSQDPFTQPSQATVTQHYIGEDEIPPFESSVHNVETDDEELRILEQPVESAAVAKSRMKKRAASATSTKTEKATQRRRQDGKVVEMMGRFLEMKEKQNEKKAEFESMQQERARSNQREDDFPIPVCIAVVDKLEDLSDDERVEAYDVFKDPQNRAIFMTAKDSTRLKWLRKKIDELAK